MYDMMKVKCIKRDRGICFLMIPLLMPSKIEI